ncbi:MAG: VWA domain-containing protein, partial [Deltaproteobacteria bacterium]
MGVISFSVEMNPQTGRRVRYDQQDAWLEVPLTADFGAVRARLPEILRRGPNGGTNFAAGIRLAITELSTLSGAHS